MNKEYHESELENDGWNKGEWGIFWMFIGAILLIAGGITKGIYDVGGEVKIYSTLVALAKCLMSIGMFCIVGGFFNILGAGNED